MIPNYETAAAKAIETIVKYDVDPHHADPAFVLRKLQNVLLLPYDAPARGENCDAFTLVNKADGKLQYIVVYNESVSRAQLRLALARELGHVMLMHDGSSSEREWSEEANCFAYHFLCPVPAKRKINFRPQRHSLLWELKGLQTFDSVDHMKVFVASEQNKKNKFIGKEIVYDAADVELIEQNDDIMGWKNCFDVVLDGKTIGFCGE